MKSVNPKQNNKWQYNSNEDRKVDIATPKREFNAMESEETKAGIRGDSFSSVVLSMWPDNLDKRVKTGLRHLRKMGLIENYLRKYQIFM